MRRVPVRHQCQLIIIRYSKQGSKAAKSDAENKRIRAQHIGRKQAIQATFPARELRAFIGVCVAELFAICSPKEEILFDDESVDHLLRIPYV